MAVEGYMWREACQGSPAHSDLPKLRPSPLTHQSRLRMNGVSLVNTIELVRAISFKTFQKAPAEYPPVSRGHSSSEGKHTPAKAGVGRSMRTAPLLCRTGHCSPAAATQLYPSDSRMPPQKPTPKAALTLWGNSFSKSSGPSSNL